MAPSPFRYVRGGPMSGGTVHKEYDKSTKLNKAYVHENQSQQLMRLFRGSSLLHKFSPQFLNIHENHGK